MDLEQRFVLDPAKGALGQILIMLITSVYDRMFKFRDTGCYPNNTARELMTQHNVPVYDFVIVGSSTAGCIMTHRLSETGEFKVLLMESGTYPSPTSNVPFFHFTLENTAEDWQFLTEKQPYACKGYEEEKCMLSRGKVLGGTTTINNMHYYRGSSLDFDRWDIKEWQSSILEQYFKNLERYRGQPEVPFDVGTKGNLSLTYFDSNHFLRQPLTAMYRQAGYKRLNEERTLGYMNILVNSVDNMRANMPRTFLKPVKDNRNLHLALGTTATKIHFSKDNRVVGLDVIMDGAKKYLRIRKELILTGGAINNAKLLLLSGIGPKEELDKHKIPMIVDLPVGKNLQIHLKVPVFFAVDRCCGNCTNCKSFDCRNRFFHMEDLYHDTWDYIMERTGSLTNTGINEFVAYINTNQRQKDIPNIGIFHFYFKRYDFHMKTFLRTQRYDPIIADSILKHNQKRNLLIFLPTLLTPESRGEVTLMSTKPEDPPIIQPNFLSDERQKDFHSLFSAVTMLVSLADTEPMQIYRAEFLKIDIPKCRNLKFGSLRYFRCYILNLSNGARNVGCSTPMGYPCCNETPIVTDTLQNVIDTRGLRIGDLSIAPKLGSTTQLVSDSIFGEILSDEIRIKWCKNYVSYYKKDKRAPNMVI